MVIMIAPASKYPLSLGNFSFQWRREHACRHTSSCGDHAVTIEHKFSFEITFEIGTGALAQPQAVAYITPATNDGDANASICHVRCFASPLLVLQTAARARQNESLSLSPV